ncbi:MAG: cobalamin B12-binding domain-containing protein, partial [Deltaproteobacteria bacterium]|nr:cobalamin B12-binding domain-containing protein [Deltaproteobacteria bacterium]
VLDAVRPRLTADHFAAVVRRLSFFINSGIELVPEIAKVRAYFQLWPTLCRDCYGVPDAAFRAGCQVRSLGLTAAQPEVNIVRIALEALPVLLQADARVHALQLPGFREALQIPDAAEQALSLRTQQVLMHETQLAAYGDLFAGSRVIERETARTAKAARDLALRVRAMGYARAIEHIAAALGEAMVRRQRQIESGELPVVGVNCFTDPTGIVIASPQGEAISPLGGGPNDMDQCCAALRAWRNRRDPDAWSRARDAVREALRAANNIMPASIAFARAGGTTGEWTAAVGEAAGGRFSLPIGVPSGVATHPDSAGEVQHRTRILLAKIGLDGHINALTVLAHACRNAGMEVVFLGMRQTPEGVVHAAIAEDVSVIGISSLAGNHIRIAGRLLQLLREHNAADCPIVIGGIIPPNDVERLKTMGITEVFTPQDADVGKIVARFRALA